jgi:hypothetical protein
LEEFTDPKNFKTYAELKEKLDRVLGLSTTDTTETFGTGPEAPRNAPFDGGSPYIPKEAVSPTPTTAAGEETDEEMSYFKQLAED